MFTVIKGNINTYTCIGVSRLLFAFLASVMAKNLKSKIDWYIVNRVRELRIQKGISQADIAYHLDFSVGYIGHIESPKFRAKYNAIHINELAKLLKVSPRDFWPEKPL